MNDSLFVLAWTAVFLAACALFGWLVVAPLPPHGEPHSLRCHAAGGWWVAATLDKHGNPKMYACVDDAGRLVRLSEAE